MIDCTACGAHCEDDATLCAACGQAPASSDPRIGRVIADRYEVRELLGRGGMGVVYKAYDRLLEEVVALKLLRGEMASPELARRFRDEIRFARRVSHRNVCRIHEYGEAGPLRYISMAFVDGIDLKHVLAREGPLPPGAAIDTGRAVAAGLQAIHDEGIVHRDLKTANIMRDRKGVVRLMDFGIAKDWSAGATGQTATGVIVGTPEYMSPEQAMGRRTDARSDLYSLGVVLYELFTARVPFRGDTPMATLLRHIQEPLRLDTPEAARVPIAARPVLLRALAKSPDERFASASELADALAEVRPAVGPETTSLDAPTFRAGTGSPTPNPSPVPWTPSPTATAADLTPAATAVPVGPLDPTRVAPRPPAFRPTPVPPESRLLWPAVIGGVLIAATLIGLVTWGIVRPAFDDGREVARDTPERPLPPGPSPTASATPVVRPTPERSSVVPAPPASTPAAVRSPGPITLPTPARTVLPSPSTAAKPPSTPPTPDASAARAEAAAAQAAWDAVVRVADDAARPEAERVAELQRFLDEAGASPHKAEAAQRLAKLQEDARRRLLAPPDAATLGRQRRASYVGGTLHEIAEGTAGAVAFPDKDRMVFAFAGSRFAIVPFRGVSSIEYGLTDHIRGLVFKKKSHYLSLTYRDAAGETQGMVLELGADEFRPVLTMLEARTGHKVQYQDEKAARERWK